MAHLKYRKCYNAKTGDTKSFAPAVYNNGKLMARLGWQLLPEIDELPELSKSESHGMLQQPGPAETAKTAEVETKQADPKMDAPEPKATKRGPYKKRNPKKQSNTK